MLAACSSCRVRGARIFVHVKLKGYLLKQPYLKSISAEMNLNIDKYPKPHPVIISFLVDELL